LFRQALKSKDDILECHVDGPVLLLALRNGDVEMLKMIVEKFVANVDQKVYFDGNLSTPLIFALKYSGRYFLHKLTFKLYQTMDSTL
jgi:hypothetical protein